MIYQIDQISGLTDIIAGFLPASLSGFAGPIVALVTIAIGWVVSEFIGGLVSGAINRTGLGRQAKSTGGNIGKSIGKAVKWIVLLVFVLVGLSQWEQVSSALEPIQEMLNNVWGYLPRLASAAIILVVGGVVARVVKETLSSTLEAAQVDRWATKFNVAGAAESGAPANSIARSLGGFGSAIIWMTFGVVAVQTLDIPGISEPVEAMLNTVLTYIPNIFGAAIILAIAVFIARFVSNLAKSTLPALGVDNSLKTLSALDGDDAPSFVPSALIANIAFIGILLMGLTAATQVLGVEGLENVFNTLLEVGGRIVLGAVIIGVGLFIANTIARIVTQTSGELAGSIIKYASILIFTFMGLRAMEIGEEIVDAAFQYGLGAAAVAAGIGGALAFGLGGRDWAGKKLNKWFK